MRFFPTWFGLPRSERVIGVVVYFLLLGVAALFSFWATLPRLQNTIQYAGLGCLLAAIVVTGSAGWGLLKKQISAALEGGSWGKWKAPMLTWGICSLIAVGTFPLGNRILMDEVVVLSTSKAIHEEREIVTPSSNTYVAGVNKLTGGYIDKRPFLYAACVAVVHDILGYSPRNAFYANMVMASLVLALVGVLGRKWGGHPSLGCLAMLGITSVPLFPQNATGGGIDIINILMILVLLFACGEYLERPSPGTARFMLGASVLLAYARYESSIYLALPVFFSVLVLKMHGRFYWDFWVAVLPATIIPLVGIHYLTFSNPVLWFQFADKGVTAGFSTDYFASNIGHALNFFLNTEHTLCNSPLVFVVGVMAFLLLVVSGVRAGKVPRMDPAGLCFSAFASISVINFFLLMCYSWGELDQPVGSRLSLPIYLCLVLGIVRASREYAQSRKYVATMAALLLLSLYWTLPPLAAKNYGQKIYGAAAVLQVLEELNQSQPDRRFAVVSGITNYWLTRDVYCVSPQSLNSNPEFLKKMISSEQFRRIYFIQKFKKDSKTEQYVLEKENGLSFDVDTEPISSDAVADGEKVTIALIKRVKAKPGEVQIQKTRQGQATVP